MEGIVFYKMTGSGNDFVFVDGRSVPLERFPGERVAEICSRGVGVGADGFVLLEPGSKSGAIRFHFFNSDGQRAPMCGNAALCATRLAAWLELASGEGMVLETDAGRLTARCLPGPGQRAELVLPWAAEVSSPEVPLAGGERAIHLATVGVPHLVVIVDDLTAVPLLGRGRELRYHPAVGSEGANVNFIANGAEGWAMRTYERGVEAETLACGTGAVAAAAVLARAGAAELPLEIRTCSGAAITVSAKLAADGRLEAPRLAGEGRLVYRAVLMS